MAGMRRFDCISWVHLLVADSIQVKRIDKSDYINCYKYSVHPCILIGHLAVDKRFQRRGVGHFLLSIAVGLAIDGPMGCRYLSVDPKSEAIEFYQDSGFRFMETSSKKQNQGCTLICIRLLNGSSIKNRPGEGRNLREA
jgi:GNAT superfamily N-acetyltransferase